MKRHLFMGLGLLGALLTLGLVSAHCMTQATGKAEAYLLVAYETAKEGDLEAAQQWTKDAERVWDGIYHLAACLTDQRQLETIDQAFGALEAQAILYDAERYAYSCLNLAQRFRGLGDGERLLYFNLL